MKSCEEMADAVLRRAEAYRRRRARIRSVAAVGSALAVVMVAACVAMALENHRNDVQVVQLSTPKVASRLQMAYLSAEGWTTEEMKSRIETEMRYSLFVTDIRNLSSEEKERLLRAEKTQLETKAESIGVPATIGKSMMLNLAWDNAIFALVRGGGFRLALDHSKQVKRISAACASGYGEAEIFLRSGVLEGRDIPYRAAFDDGEERELTKKVSGDGVWLHAKTVAVEQTVLMEVLGQDGKGDGDLTVCWRPCDRLYEALNENLATPLSSFSDTMTVVVTYEDDTLDIHEIDMVFEDDGAIKAVYRGAVAVK